MFWRGKKNLSREDIFDQVENEGFARLDDALNYISPLENSPKSDSPSPSDSPSSPADGNASDPPDGLADRTCQRIWNVADHPEQYPELFTPETPSPDRKQAPLGSEKSPHPGSLSPASHVGPIHPKRVRFRGKGGASPFVIKSMTVYEADPNDLSPRSPQTRDERPQEPLSPSYPPKVGIPTLMYETASEAASSEPNEILPEKSVVVLPPVDETALEASPIEPNENLPEEPVAVLPPVDETASEAASIEPNENLPEEPVAVLPPVDETVLEASPIEPNENLPEEPVAVLPPVDETVLEASPIEPNENLPEEPVAVLPPVDETVLEAAPIEPNEILPEEPVAVPTRMYDQPLIVPERPFVAVAMRMYSSPLQVENDPSRPVLPPSYASPVEEEPTSSLTASEDEASVPVEVTPISEPVLSPSYASPVEVKSKPSLAAVESETSVLDEGKALKESVNLRREKKPKYLSPLLNGEIRKEAQDEYYWEYLPPETEDEKKMAMVEESPFPEEKEKSTLITSAVTRIGSGTITEVRRLSSWLGFRHDRPKAEKEESEETRRSSNVTDILVSMILGVLIAVTIIFPLCRFCVNELAVVIAKSNVRRIGQTIQVNPETNEIKTAPAWTEQLLYPKSQEVILEPIPESTPEGLPEGNNPF